MNSREGSLYGMNEHQPKMIKISEDVRNKWIKGGCFMTYHFDRELKEEMKCLNMLLCSNVQKYQSAHVSPVRLTAMPQKNSQMDRLVRLSQRIHEISHRSKSIQEKQNKIYFEKQHSKIKSPIRMKMLFTKYDQNKKKIPKIPGNVILQNISANKQFNEPRNLNRTQKMNRAPRQTVREEYLKIRLHKIFEFKIDKSLPSRLTTIRQNKKQTKIIKPKRDASQLLKQKKIEQFFLYSRQLHLKQKIKKHIKEYGIKNQYKNNLKFIKYFPHTDYELALKQFLNRQQKIEMNHNCKSLELSFHCEYDIETRTLKTIPPENYNFFKKQLYKIPPRASSCVNITEFNSEKYNISISRQELIAAILKAKNDNKIKGILLDDIDQKIQMLKKRKSKGDLNDENQPQLRKNTQQRSISKYFQSMSNYCGIIQTQQKQVKSSSFSSDDEHNLKQMLSQIAIPGKDGTTTVLLKNSNGEMSFKDINQNNDDEKNKNKDLFEFLQLDRLKNDVKQWIKTENIISNHLKSIKSMNNKKKAIPKIDKKLPQVNKLQNSRLANKTTTQYPKQVPKKKTVKLSIILEPDIIQPIKLIQDKNAKTVDVNKQNTRILQIKHQKKLKTAKIKSNVSINQNNTVHFLNDSLSLEDKQNRKSAKQSQQHKRESDNHKLSQQQLKIMKNLQLKQAHKEQIIEIFKKIEENMNDTTECNRIQQNVYPINKEYIFQFQKIRQKQIFPELILTQNLQIESFSKNYVSSLKIFLQLGSYPLKRIVEIYENSQKITLNKIYLYFSGMWHQFTFNKVFQKDKFGIKYYFLQSKIIFLGLYHCCLSIYQKFHHLIKFLDFPIDWYLKLFTGLRVISFKKRQNMDKQLKYHYEKSHKIFMISNEKSKQYQQLMPSILQIVKIYPILAGNDQKSEQKYCFSGQQIAKLKNKHQFQLQNLLQLEYDLLSVSIREHLSQNQKRGSLSMLNFSNSMFWTHFKLSYYARKVSIFEITAEKSTIGSFTIYSNANTKNHQKSIKATFVLCKQVKKAIKMPKDVKQIDRSETVLKQIGRVCQKMKYDNIYFQCNIHGKYMLYLYLDTDKNQELILSYEGKETIYLQQSSRVEFQDQMIINQK